MKTTALLALLFLSGLTVSGSWKKHVVVQKQPGQGSMNVAVASDFDGDGRMDVMTSFGGGVSVFRGPDWRESRQVTRFADAYKGKRKLRSGCIHGCLLDVDGDGDEDLGSNQMVSGSSAQTIPSTGTDLPGHRRRDPRHPLLITGGVTGDGKLDLIANSGRPADTFQLHRLAEGTRRPQVRPSMETPCLRRQGCSRRFPHMGLGASTGTACPTSHAAQREERNSPEASGSPSGNRPGTARPLGRNVFFPTGNREPPTFFPPI